MKQLSKEQLSGVARDINESPSLVKWLRDSRDENRINLETASPETVKGLQGENTALNQMLDKLIENV